MPGEAGAGSVGRSPAIVTLSLEKCRRKIGAIYFSVRRNMWGTAALAGPLGAARLLYRLQLKWQLPQPLPRRRKYRIRHRRRDWRQGRLSHPSWIFFAHDQMHFDRRSLGNPKRIVSIKISLFDRPILNRDLILQRRAQSINNRAFGLRAHRFRIHDLPAIHPSHNAIDLEAAALDRHFRHFAKITSERVVASDASALALG